MNTTNTFEWKGRLRPDGTRRGRQAVRMQRKPLVATVLVSAVVAAVLGASAPAALASDHDSREPVNRGWESGSKNRGWDHDDRAGHSADH